jgi:hypothetical protein
VLYIFQDDYPILLPADSRGYLVYSACIRDVYEGNRSALQFSRSGWTTGFLIIAIFEFDPNMVTSWTSKSDCLSYWRISLMFSTLLISKLRLSTQLFLKHSECYYWKRESPSNQHDQSLSSFDPFWESGRQRQVLPFPSVIFTYPDRRFVLLRSGISGTLHHFVLSRDRL